MVRATNKATGELVELEADTLEQVVTAWRVCQEYIKTADELKTQLQKLLPQFINEDGRSEEYNGHMFKNISVQRMNYNKSALYELIDDEDLRFQMLKPDKSFIDQWLKDNIETTGEIGVQLRKCMIEDGKPYSYYKLEKLSRGDYES